VSEYVVIYEEAEDGAWGAYLPDLPGVVALGSDRAEVSERLKDALAAYTDDLRERGEELPAPHHVVGMIAA
jgi:predicted RNase H-like HicB family nuclease